MALIVVLFVLDPNLYRLVNGLGYMIFVAGSTIALILVASTSIAALRADLLPRWLAWIGLAIAVRLTAATQPRNAKIGTNVQAMVSA